MQSQTDSKKSALAKFQLFYEEVPTEEKHERRSVKETRIRRPSVA